MLTSLTKSYQKEMHKMPRTRSATPEKNTQSTIKKESNFREYHPTSNFEDYRKGLIRPLEKQEISGSMHDLRKLLASLKDINHDPENLNDLIDGVYPKKSLVHGENDEKLREKNMNQVGKLLGNIQDYLSTNLKEISDIRSMVIPPNRMEEMRELSDDDDDEEFAKNLMNINIFGTGNNQDKVSFLKGSHLNREARRQFKEEIEATEKKVQEMQLQKLMSKIKSLNERVSQLQKDMEEKKENFSLMIEKFEKSLCAGYCFISESEENLGEKEENKKFLALGLDSLKFYINPEVEQPSREIKRGEISDIIEIKSSDPEAKSPMFFKIEIAKESPDHPKEFLFFLPINALDAERWDTAFFSFNVKASLTNNNPFLLSNKQLIFGMTKALEEERKITLGIPNVIEAFRVKARSILKKEDDSSINSSGERTPLRTPLNQKGNSDKSRLIKSDMGRDRSQTSKKIHFKDIGKPKSNSDTPKPLSNFSNFLNKQLEETQESAGYIPLENSSEKQSEMNNFDNRKRASLRDPIGELENSPSGKKSHSSDDRKVTMMNQRMSMHANVITSDDKLKMEFKRAARNSISREKYDEYIDMTKNIKILRNGFFFMKYGKYGTPHERLVYLSEDEKNLEWKSTLQKKSGGSIPLIGIISISEGRATAIFKKYKIKNAEQVNLSFSLITEKRSLDLEASRKEHKTSFLHALKYILDHRYTV